MLKSGKAEVSTSSDTRQGLQRAITVRNTGTLNFFKKLKVYSLIIILYNYNLNTSNIYFLCACHLYVNMRFLMKADSIDPYKEMRMEILADTLQ